MADAGTLTRADIAEAINRHVGLSRADASAMIESILDHVLDALVAGEQGIADLRAIARCARRHLHPGGVLLLEHGATQSARLAAELVGLGYARVVCHRDLAGLDRVTEATWN